MSQWVDAGWRDIDVVQDGLSGFPKGRRVGLSILDYAYVLMAEGVVWVAEENIERALANFNLVLSLRAEISDKEILALAHFWSSRCNRKGGEYDQALEHVSAAGRLALEAGAGPMAATMRVAESWLLFQKSRTKDALKMLAEAEAVLRETDDYITRGNIQSSYGRMYRREGRYDLGLRHFFQAIEEYGKRDPEHRNLARTLANMGYVERLIALQLRKRIDSDAAQRKRSEPDLRRDYENMRSQALAHLDRASEIYHLHANHRGAGTVCVNRGHLHLDSGDLYKADDEAREAYALGNREGLHPDGAGPAAGVHGGENQAGGGNRRPGVGCTSCSGSGKRGGGTGSTDGKPATAFARSDLARFDNLQYVAGQSGWGARNQRTGGSAVAE